MRNKTLMKLVLFAFLIGAGLIGYSQKNISPMAVLEQPKIIQENYKYMQVYFCETDDCGKIQADLIKNTENPDCAFYDIDLENMVSELSKKNYRLVTNDHSKISLEHKFDTNKALMHDKFCIYSNNTFSSGSFNPKEASLFKDYNNLIVIQSDYLSQNYRDEFEELFSGIFGSGAKVRYPKVQYGDILIENYFCPEDSCQKHVLEQMDKANSSIYGLLFSFTDSYIAEKLVEKKNLDIKLVVEKQRMNMQYEKYKFLKENGINIKTDSNPYLLHDKVWIIDRKIVITGSYNPTASGNTKNDENILIIHSSELAEKLLKRFDSIYSSAN